MSKFSESLKDLIIEHNYSQNFIANNAGISTSDISDYCNGTLPNINNLIKLSDFFNCSSDYLLGLTDNIGNKSIIKNIEFSINGFFDRLDKLLSVKNLTYYKLAKLAGIHKNTIYNWKSDRNPSVETLIKLADYLGTSVDYLIGRSNS